MSARTLLCGLAMLLLTSCTTPTGDTPEFVGPPADFELEGLSTRAEYATGGDLLVGLTGSELDPEQLVTTIDRELAELTWEPDDAGRLVTRVDGLSAGEHELAVTDGNRGATLRIVDHPVTGPLFSGPHLPLAACSTETYGLGSPVDDDCSAAAPVVSWSYVNQAGERVPLDDPTTIPDDVARLDDGTTPFVLREEKGTINRAVYWITVVDPAPEPTALEGWDSSHWNGRLVYDFGGGCGTTYSQGFTLLGPPDLALLEAGYANVTSTFNTFQVHCNALLSAETTMMVKEHFAESYGPPDLTIGTGGSGGAIQQYQIIQNYPGLLDASAALLPFPDALSIAGDVVDCGLLQRFFGEAVSASWSPEAELAVTGHRSAGTCRFWQQTFVPGIDPTTGCALPLLEAAGDVIDGLGGAGTPPSPDESLVYDPEGNPDGLRCTFWDTNVNVLGRDAETGFARRPWANAGVQYGLGALNDGAIDAEQFLALNESIGSFDTEGQWTAGRAEADIEAVEAAYSAGAVNLGEGDLRRIPIITVDIWTDDQGDIHTRDRAFATRERLRLPDGSDPPNHMIWTRGLPAGDNLVDSLTGSVGLGLEIVTVLDEWATALHDELPDPDAEDEAALWDAIEATRPADAVDNCLAADGERLSGSDLYEEPGPCRDLYPVSESPRVVAGAPLRNDTIACALRPLDEAVADGVYEVDLTDDQVARLEAIFPDGVCDWSEPGLGTTPIDGTWQSYAEDAQPGAD